MEPYPENHALWRGFHAAAIIYLRDELQTRLPRPFGPLPPHHYLACISRPRRRSSFEVFPIPIGRRLPWLPIPLTSDYSDVPLDLQLVFDRSYDSGAYSRLLECAKAPPGPLADEDLAWVRERINERSTAAHGVSG
jgi:hypothetical protein